MLKFKDDYTTLTATFEDFILFIQLLMICINGLSLYAFPKGGMCILQRCLILK